MPPFLPALRSHMGDAAAAVVGPYFVPWTVVQVVHVSQESEQFYERDPSLAHDRAA